MSVLNDPKIEALLDALHAQSEGQSGAMEEYFGRRVNVMAPDESLILKKPLMEVAHGGGRRLLPADRLDDHGFRDGPDGHDGADG